MKLNADDGMEIGCFLIAVSAGIGVAVWLFRSITGF